MTPQKALDRLRSMVEPDLERYQRNIIIKQGKDYDVFVIYRVSAGADVYRREDFIAKFSSPKVALSWCIADKYQQYHLAQEILGLDQHLQRLEDDITVRASLCDRFRTATARNAAQTKIDTRRQSLRHTQERLDKCVNLAKYWQIRGFNNETARSGRAPSHTKSR
jgi:hypothetical protein